MSDQDLVHGWRPALIVQADDLPAAHRAGSGLGRGQSRDVEFFAQVQVDTGLGTVVWPNGADLAPEVLHEQALSVA